MATAFPPSKVIPFTDSGSPYDIDFTASRLGTSTTRQTYVVVTSRSYHPSGLNVLFLDGSVRGVARTVQQAVWRALGTRSDGEVVRAGSY